MAMYYVPYLAFEREAWRKFGRDLKLGKFDLVHRITPMSPTLPSPMAKWSPRPFVIGPLNGGLKWPAGFTAELAREREYLTYIRNAFRILPYSHTMWRRSAAVLAAFDHTINDLKATDKSRVFNVPEVGFDPELFSSPPRRQTDGRITFLYAGRLVPYKCADIAVAAFAAEPTLRHHRLRIVGDGPERPHLEHLIRENHLEACVELVGQLTQSEVGQEMRLRGSLRLSIDSRVGGWCCRRGNGLRDDLRSDQLWCTRGSCRNRPGHQGPSRLQRGNDAEFR